MFAPHDIPTHAHAWSFPGIDPRQWFSFGTVDQETPDQKSVIFTKQYGPLVRCTLHPSGIPVVCRVSHEVAGNGEGEWFPFVAGDEVMVAIPEGDESAGCVIFGRLNQEIDQWPQQVAGQDATTNTFAFRRLRTPYILETAAGYMIRSAVTKAFFSIDPTGNLILSNSDNGFLALRHDFIGLQSGDATTLIQIDVNNKRVVMEANGGTKMVIDASASSLYTTGTLQLGTAGNQAAEHATSAEAMVGFVFQVVTALGAILTPTLTPAQVLAVINTALAAIPATSYAPFIAGITAALQAVKAPGSIAGIGAPGLLVG